MAEYIFQVFQDDDATLAFEVGTAADHPYPYLKLPTQFQEASVDLMNGTALIGQMNVEVVDPQTGATQADRFLTALLGDAVGYSAINGRRGVFAEATSPERIIVDGICWGVRLTDTYAGFAFALQDPRSRGNHTRAFTVGGTSCVFPRGIVGGYGALPDGTLMVPAVTPRAGTFVTEASGVGRINLDGRPTKPDSVVAADLVVTDTMVSAISDGRWNRSTPSGFSQFTTNPSAELWWRPEGGGSWSKVKQVDGTTPAWLDITMLAAKVVLTDGSKADVRAATAIRFAQPVGGGPYPTENQRVECIIVYLGEPSNDYPFHFEGTWGTIVRNLLRGDYSGQDPRIRYNAAAVLAIDAPVRVRITEPIEGGDDGGVRKALEMFCKAIGAAPALNAAAEIAPVVYALPAWDLELPQVDGSNCKAEPGWDHPADNAITLVNVKYPRDIYVPAERDPEHQVSAGDGIMTQDITIPHRAEAAVIDVMGEHPLDIDAFCFRGLGGEDGQPLDGGLVDDSAGNIAHARAHQALDRFVYGGQLSSVTVARSEFPGLKPGDWVLDARAWAPDYASGKRGRNSLSQVIATQELNPAYLGATLLDAGPLNNPVALPTFGSTSIDTSGRLNVPVTALPAGGGEARVDYAISDTEPSNTSPLWTFLGRTAGATATLVGPPLPDDATVWWRGRGEAVGRRASVWTSPASVAVGARPAVRSAKITIDSETGIPTITFEVTASTLGMRLYYEEHAPDDTPGMATYLDVAASAGSHAFAAIGFRRQFSVDAEPWTGWTGAAVSGSAGDKVRAAAVRPAGTEAANVYLSSCDIVYDPSASPKRLLASCKSGVTPEAAGMGVRIDISDAPDFSNILATGDLEFSAKDDVLELPYTGTITGGIIYYARFKVFDHWGGSPGPSPAWVDADVPAGDRLATYEARTTPIDIGVLNYLRVLNTEWRQSADEMILIVTAEASLAAAYGRYQYTDTGGSMTPATSSPPTPAKWGAEISSFSSTDSFKFEINGGWSASCPYDITILLRAYNASWVMLQQVTLRFAKVGETGQVGSRTKTQGGSTLQGQVLEAKSGGGLEFAAGSSGNPEIKLKTGDFIIVSASDPGVKPIPYVWVETS